MERIFASDVTLSGSTVSENSTIGDDSDGGGIYAFGEATLTASTLSGNRALGDGSDGGAIYTRSRLVSMMSSTVTGNSANGSGGGIFSDNPFRVGYQEAMIENSIIAGNFDGGTAPDLKFDSASPPTISHSLVGDTTGSGSR